MHRVVFYILVASFCFSQPAHGQSPVREASLTEIYNPLVDSGIREIEMALDEYYLLVDDRDLELFVSAVTHAARGRLLLEQFLGENTDNYSAELRKRNRYVGSLILIAGLTKKFCTVTVIT